MLVVCWVGLEEGGSLTARVTSREKGLNFTPGYGMETPALAKALTMDELVAYLHDHAHAETCA